MLSLLNTSLSGSDCDPHREKSVQTDVFLQFYGASVKVHILP